MRTNVKQYLAFLFAFIIASFAFAEGGMSGGGGNAKGPKFFDFYENEGSSKLSHQRVSKWNNKVATILLRANELVPQVGFNTSHGLGDVLIQAIQARKWLLEPKPMTDESCMNESLVYSVDQKIVGCQNFYEVRISKSWLENPKTDELNAAGLVVHEAILTWLRDLKIPNFSKQDLEFSVREINRMLFDGTAASEFLENISKLVPSVTFYSTEEASFEKLIPAKFLEVKSRYCSSQRTDKYEEVMQMMTNQKSYSLVNDTFKDYIELVQLQMLIATKEKVGQNVSKDSKKLQQMKQRFCNANASSLPDVSQLVFNPKVLSAECKSQIEDVFQNYIRLKSLNYTDLMEDSDHVAHSAAFLCSGLKGIELQRTTFWPFMNEKKGRAIMDEVKLQAFKYYTILKENL